MRPRFRSAFMAPSGFVVTTPAVDTPRASTSTSTQGRTSTSKTSEATKTKTRAEAA